MPMKPFPWPESPSNSGYGSWQGGGIGQTYAGDTEKGFHFSNA
jgi:hypothetical protein